MAEDKMIVELKAEIERLQVEVAGLTQGRDPAMSLWRGLCGHHWLRSESINCPICREVTDESGVEALREQA